MREEKYVCEENTMPENNSNVNIMRIVKIMLLICMVCFFMPFVTVSCSHMGCTASGVEIASGIFSESTRDMADGNEIPLNVFVAASLLATVVAFVFVMKKKDNSKKAAILSAVSAVCLILFMITFTTYYGFGEEDMYYITVEYHFSVWAIIVLNIASTVLLVGDKKVINNVYNNTSKSVCNKVGQLKDMYEKYSVEKSEEKSKIEDVDHEIISGINVDPEKEELIESTETEVKADEAPTSRLKLTMRTTTNETTSEESDKFKPAGDL